MCGCLQRNKTGASQQAVFDERVRGGVAASCVLRVVGWKDFRNQLSVKTHALEVELHARSLFHTRRYGLQLQREALSLLEDLRCSAFRLYSSNQSHMGLEVDRAVFRAVAVDRSLDLRTRWFSRNEPQRMTCVQRSQVV